MKYNFLERYLSNAVKISVTGTMNLYDILRNDIEVYSDGTLVNLELVGRDDNHIVSFNKTSFLVSSGFGNFKESIQFTAKDETGEVKRVMTLLKSDKPMVELTIEKLDEHVSRVDAILLDKLDGYGNKFKISILKNSNIKGEM